MTLMVSGAGACIPVAIALSQLGCNWLLDIDKEYTIAQEPGPYGATAASTGAGLPPECIPSENSGPVGDGCGAFVALSGDDYGDGTKDDPVNTLKRAVQLAKGSGNVVYACAESFDEVVELPAGVSLFGGLDCKGDWGYGGESKRTVIASVVAADPPPMAEVIPLKVLGNGDTRIENVDVRAPDAVLPGGSSIAVIVENTTATIANCTFTAGAGAAGATGEKPTVDIGPPDPKSDAIKGVDGTEACAAVASSNAGGMGKANTLCSMSIGGNGGAGDIVSGSSGTNGEPQPNPNPDNAGIGGAGAMAGSCKSGQDGQFGTPGGPGAGATAADVGSLSSSGYAGVSGQDGTAGSPGQGGGGGGGAKGKTGCGGASGGGGGAGGCGGNGGLGGKAGGASIALVSLNAELTFENVALKAGAGGIGGEGGDGQDGGIGGNGGKGGVQASGTFPGCSGGAGGVGGYGGKGGGGRGGHSLGIAYKGKLPPKEGVMTTVGTPGEGGTGADMTGNGAAGEGSQTFQFKD